MGGREFKAWESEIPDTHAPPCLADLPVCVPLLLRASPAHGVAVEVLEEGGPGVWTVLTAQSSRLRLGGLAVARRALLRSAGYRVVDVPSWRWQQLGPESRSPFLQALFPKAGGLML